MVIVAKVCIDCGVTKPLDGFNRHPGTADGRQGRCRACYKIFNHEARKVRLSEYRERDLARESQESRKVTKAAYRRRWRERFPEKYKAHYTLTNAVRDGRLKKQPCGKCGRDEVDAHHDDYSRPLDVRWLCRVCHLEEHGRYMVA